MLDTVTWKLHDLKRSNVPLDQDWKLVRNFPQPAHPRDMS